MSAILLNTKHIPRSHVQGVRKRPDKETGFCALTQLRIWHVPVPREQVLIICGHVRKTLKHASVGDMFDSMYSIIITLFTQPIPMALRHWLAELQLGIQSELTLKFLKEHI